MENKNLSIVTTLYKSSIYIDKFVERCSVEAKKYFGDNYEIILVNDGSPDDSFEQAIQVSQKNKNCKVVNLSRNFGHHHAMMAGLNISQGDLVFLLDSDLEEEPEVLSAFLDKMSKDNLDVVYGVQEKRRNGGFFDQITANLYYKTFNFFTGINQTSNIVTARLMTKEYVKALLLYKEREIHIGGLWIIAGFNQDFVKINKYNTSPTTYTFRKKFSHLVNAITSFSNLPLVFVFYLGSFIFLTSLVYITYLIYLALFLAEVPPGYTSIIASIWLFSGLMIFSIGILGIYISKIFSEVKRRPRYIVKAIHMSKEQKIELNKNESYNLYKVN